MTQASIVVPQEEVMQVVGELHDSDGDVFDVFGDFDHNEHGNGVNFKVDGERRSVERSDTFVIEGNCKSRISEGVDVSQFDNDEVIIGVSITT